jgi:hypothetical protein
MLPKQCDTGDHDHSQGADQGNDPPGFTCALGVLEPQDPGQRARSSLLGVSIQIRIVVLASPPPIQLRRQWIARFND